MESSTYDTTWYSIQLRLWSAHASWVYIWLIFIVYFFSATYAVLKHGQDYLMASTLFSHLKVWSASHVTLRFLFATDHRFPPRAKKARRDDKSQSSRSGGAVSRNTTTQESSWGTCYKNIATATVVCFVRCVFYCCQDFCEKSHSVRLMNWTYINIYSPDASGAFPSHS